MLLLIISSLCIIASNAAGISGAIPLIGHDGQPQLGYSQETGEILPLWIDLTTGVMFVSPMQQPMQQPMPQPISVAALPVQPPSDLTFGGGSIDPATAATDSTRRGKRGGRRQNKASQFKASQRNAFAPAPIVPVVQPVQDLPPPLLEPEDSE